MYISRLNKSSFAINALLGRACADYPSINFTQRERETAKALAGSVTPTRPNPALDAELCRGLCPERFPELHRIASIPGGWQGIAESNTGKVT